MPHTTLTRRNFMKTAAAVAATVTAAGSVELLEGVEPASAATAERVMHKTACHGCTNCCPVRVYTENGRVVKIEGDPDGPLNKGGVCLKCLAQLQTLYSPRHVLHPMKRAGAAKTNGKPSRGTKRSIWRVRRLRPPCKSTARTLIGLLAAAVEPISNGRPGVWTTPLAAATPLLPVRANAQCRAISSPRRALVLTVVSTWTTLTASSALWTTPSLTVSAVMTPSACLSCGEVSRALRRLRTVAMAWLTRARIWA